MNDRTIPRDHPATLAKPHRPRSPVGQALLLDQEAVEHCEALYETTQGEETDETRQAEAARDLTARQALEALAQHRLYLDSRDRESAIRREALERFDAETARRREWNAAKTADLAEQVMPGRTKIQIGVRTIKLRRTTAVETGEGFDPQALPPAWRREKPERVIPASVELDRKAAGADLLLGFREGPPPSAGWYEVEGHGRMWLEPCQTEGSTEWASAPPPGTPGIAAGGCTLRSLGLSIEPEPGLDVLRWKPAPLGVRLVHRVHVTVE